ncbi:hypothetical protein ACFLYV_03340 [Chloroflexota bacterium]
MNSIKTRNFNQWDILIGVLVFGSVWGLLEATLGGFLNMILFPNKGAIMAGIGGAIIGIAMVIYRKPLMGVGIGVVAACFKVLNVWIFVPVSYIHIVNPAMAIIGESVIFSLIAVFFLEKMLKSSLAVSMAGLSTGLLSSVAFVYFALYVTQSPLLQRLGISGPAEYIASTGLVHGAFMGILLALGFVAGKRLAHAVDTLTFRRPVYIAASVATVVVCWAVSGLVIASGF